MPAPDYQRRQFDYRRSSDQDAAVASRHPVVVVGAGPIGLTLATDLAQQGVPVVLLDDDNKLSFGSRAICFAKRTLEIWDRLGCGQRMVDKGVSWNVGKVFFRDELVYQFDLLPETGHARPAFINLQQYYCEGYLYEQALATPGIDLRWKNKLVGLSQNLHGIALQIDTPEGPYALDADYVVACDGSRSSVRECLGLESKGQIFRDRFLIADVKMSAPFPTERWFWFDPPFHRNQSVLLHKQPDDVWRIDFQLGWDADPEEEKKPEKVIPRVKALLGEDTKFEFEWISVYTFACLRMDHFCHGRVLFAGDAAHGVSPFGARGANSGVQDADNLAWKLRLVLQGKAPTSLLDSYAQEREVAADENILNSTRATDFITPKSEVSRLFRDAVLKLSKAHPFARKLVNSGRLSVPTILRDSVLNTPDEDEFSGALLPGAPAIDGPVLCADGSYWLLSLLGREFTLLHFIQGDEQVETTQLDDPVLCKTVTIALDKRAVQHGIMTDGQGLLAKRYDARPGTLYLLRPDQHVCARWRAFDARRIRQALARATGQ